jgi:hypothetical protein
VTSVFAEKCTCGAYEHEAHMPECVLMKTINGVVDYCDPAFPPITGVPDSYRPRYEVPQSYTVKDVERLMRTVRAVKVGWPFKTWNVTFTPSVALRGMLIAIELKAYPPHRDTGDQSIELYYTWQFNMDVMLPLAEKQIVEKIFDLWERFLGHEAAESFQYDDKRPFDPHAPGKVVTL